MDVFTMFTNIQMLVMLRNLHVEVDLPFAFICRLYLLHFEAHDFHTLLKLQCPVCDHVVFDPFPVFGS